MLVYRLAQKKYIRDLSGEKARLFGGRWNHKGTSVLYTSEHRSLALLELLVNSSKHLLQKDIYLLRLKLPVNIQIVKLEADVLPAGWRNYPAPDLLADMVADKWSQSNAAALKVPSVIVPDEWNILLNPSHSQFKECKIKDVVPFKIDMRAVNSGH